ncbi:6-hydroxymethylpterin diphosphokinase MptE-like protein [Shewanella sp. CG12_big_fil_rev_8_21_14_0_65_47_15]|uniref:6-hydroxymethylpterin diphosphokinase MptE-like protein n=1 Tax=Shewanella sp. CG12_big_fil_rev_8_21_14_0_65_47_15 TaxID=1975537 RepID=UPI000CBE1DD4|nr:6-hydroxymethylpterin diphosphokinase MptE-like protein [Shewanella sp. CG12_big_fil_rev_8_21_14_0_65_47_15]PIW60929.1 MAG: hypothetical protein COW15_10660 [Shewanella sp. CG12_big_fil_rev_8_21_14_0_65_47_15]
MNPPEEKLDFSTNAFGERYLYPVNQICFDRYDSHSVFKAHYHEVLWDDDTFNVIIGTDSGLLVDYVRQHRKQDNSVYIFVELQSLVGTVSTNCSIEEDSNIYIYGADEWESAVKHSEIAQFIYKNKLRFFDSLGARYEYLDDYHALKFKVHASLEQLSYLNRVTLGSENFIVRQLQNISENNLPAMPLKDVFTGCTAIILAGGPSLDEVLPWVIEHRKRLVVIAVSRIAKRLREVDLIPDVFVSVDPFDDSFDVSKEMLEFPPSVVFVNSYHVVSKLLAQWRGPNLYLGLRFPWKTTNNSENFYSAGPTVTNSALSFTLGIGCSKILFAGVDLCFSKEGYTHAKGSIETAQGPLLTADGLWVETNANEMAETSFPLASAREQFEIVIAELTENKFEIINLSLNAAKIKGVSYQNIQHVNIVGFPDDAKQKMQAYCDSFTENTLRQDNNMVFKELSKVQQDLKQIILLADEGIITNKKLYKCQMQHQKDRIVVKLNKIQSKLDKNFAYLARLLKTYGLTYFVEYMDPSSIEHWDDTQLEKSGDLYYQAYKKSAKKLLKLIDSSIERVVARKEELKSQPDFELMFSTWRRDKQLGRAYLWMQKHTLAAQSLVTQQSFEQILVEYNAEINSNDTDHAQFIAKRASAEGVEHKATQLFAKRDLHGLQKLALSLSLQPNNNGAKDSLTHLLFGYINVLVDNNDAALEHFQQTSVDSHRMYALNHLVGIELGKKHFPEAIVGLKELCKFSPRYLIKLAHLQYLTGDPLAAVDVYNQYLTLFGDDTHAWMALAKIFFELGATESAQIACDYVVSVEPQNKLAAAMLLQIGQSA